MGLKLLSNFIRIQGMSDSEDSNNSLSDEEAADEYASSDGSSSEGKYDTNNILRNLYNFYVDDTIPQQTLKEKVTGFLKSSSLASAVKKLFWGNSAAASLEKELQNLLFDDNEKPHHVSMDPRLFSEVLHLILNKEHVRQLLS